ncbi:MAG: 5'-nucleotidase [gamma proteobacterium symbiont of Bathyaustriella thionipta]|nr:5'-nucleotidase [gamma proteobacterium symbiont of Bathyaustriella thionipta]
MENQSDQLVVAISSRALFDLSESHQVFEQEGVAAYADYQMAHEDEPLQPGVGFALVKKLLNLNIQAGKSLVDVVLLSRNSSDTGLRIFNSIEAHALPVSRAAFTGGENPYAYAQALGAKLFLSADQNDVKAALSVGLAAATLLIRAAGQAKDDGQLRIAFDGDAVLFSDEAERVFQQKGLAEFSQSEKSAANHPLEGGPFKPFLQALNRIQLEWPAGSCPVRTALITARAAPAHERVIRTLRAWNIRIDEALFLGGLAKGEFLKAFAADMFFDDQRQHCENASEHVAAGHVPHGVANK